MQISAAFLCTSVLPWMFKKGGKNKGRCVRARQNHGRHLVLPAALLSRKWVCNTGVLCVTIHCITRGTQLQFEKDKYGKSTLKKATNSSHSSPLKHGPTMDVHGRTAWKKPLLPERALLTEEFQSCGQTRGWVQRIFFVFFFFLRKRWN